MSVVPAQAGRSAKREERPQDGPEGVSEANHLVSLMIFKSLGPGLRRDDEHLGTLASRVKTFPGHPIRRYPHTVSIELWDGKRLESWPMEGRKYWNCITAVKHE